MNASLDMIESRLQAWIEVSLLSLLPWDSTRGSLAKLFIEAIESAFSQQGLEEALAPNVYSIAIPAQQFPDWQANPDLPAKLAEFIYQTGSEAGLIFPDHPIIRLICDQELAPGQLKVEAKIVNDPLSETSVLQPIPPAPCPLPENPLNAYLIVNGIETFPLNLPVINIGRRLDNQLPIDDPRVSRLHAQLREIRGEHTIFDLGSSGGTFVNGERITQRILKPGDVISLAGFPLVYGRDIPQPPKSEFTPVIQPVSSEDNTPYPDETNHSHKNL
jgi:hypothetical protein